MKTRTSHVLIALVLSLFSLQIPTALAQGTAFTYQGRLNNNGSPANGSYDLRFLLFGVASNGVSLDAPATNAAVTVTNGLFTATIDFGSVFDGGSYWLEIGVRTNGGGSFTTLAPRQPVTPTPYAIMSGSASNILGTLPSGGLAGTYGSAVSFTNSGNSFSGNGSGLANLNASQLASGTVPDARLAANVARTNQVWLLNGNAGTTPVTNFLGTSDSNSLTLKVNGQGAVRFEPTYDTPNVVGGWSGNYVQAGLPGATIGGGGTVLTYNGQPQPNVITSNGYYGTIAGGYNNMVKGYGGGILAGSVNVAGDFGTIGGGQFESALGSYSFIGGGNGHTVQTNATRGVIVGGYINTIQSSGSYSFIGGGVFNQASGVGSFIGGGGYDGGSFPGNINNGNAAALVGGLGNTIEDGAYHSFLGGGYYNTISSNNESGVVVGGLFNLIQDGADASFIGGGSDNTIHLNGDKDTIAGGYYNTIQSLAPHAFIGGGSFNMISSNSDDAVIVGGANGIIGSDNERSFIGGGYYSTISSSNRASVVVGGYGNTIDSYAGYSVIGGGVYNNIRGDISVFTNYPIIASTIAGGAENQILDNSEGSTISGGQYNTVLSNSPSATIGGGVFNQVGGDSGTVPGGSGNVASGRNSFAAGMDAHATNDGSFVLADRTFSDFYSSFDNQFSARFNGGVRFVTGGTGMTLDGQPVLAGTVGSSALSGTYSSVVTFNNASDSFTGTFSGNGSGLTSLNADQLTSGTLPSGRLLGTYAALLNFNNSNNSYSGNGSSLTSLNASQLTSGVVPAGVVSGTYTNTVTFNNGTNSFTGSFAGNGGNLTNLNASQLASGTVPAGRFSGNYTNVVTLTNGGNIFAGNGGGLTNLNAGQLANGTVPAAAMSGTYTNAVTFNNSADSFSGTFGGNGNGLTNLNASQLVSGTVPAGVVSGNYTNAVTLTNVGNLFAGNGTGVTNVNAVTLNGQSSSAFAAASGSANYIQNQTAGAQVASFNISGGATVGGNISAAGTVFANAAAVTNGVTASSLTVSNAQVTGLLRSGSETGTDEAPNPAGLVIRRVNSIVSTTNLVVAIARTSGNVANITLARDGTTGGFQIHYPASPGVLTISAMGIDTNSVQRNFYTTIANPATAGVVQVYTSAQGVAHFECTFGITFNAAQHLTQVTLSRYNNDNFWSGNVISTVNQ